MSRRGNGEGNIRKTTDGRWEASVMFAGRRYWVRDRTERAVRKKLTELRRRHHVGELTPPTRLTLGDFLDQWMATSQDEWKPKTVVGYQSLIDNYWGPELGHIKLQRLTPAMIASCYSRWSSERNVTGGTLLNVHRVLHRALKVAVLWGYLPNNPADRVEPPKARRKRPKLWTPDEARHFLNGTTESRWHVMWSVLLGTGCRVGEALGLRWGDIDFNAGTMTIERAVSYPRSSTPVIVRPKSEAGIRSIQLTGQTVEALRRWKVQQAKEQLRHRGEWAADESVVTVATGRQPTPTQVRTAFNRECRELSLPKARLHDMRHLSASLLLSEGVPLPVVSARLGHSTPAITAAIYSHALGDEDALAAAALTRRLG